jgi:DNA (cytosine-5)-methyltransferase 3A
MACGMLAMQMAGIEVERYVAYEIDKYATQTACHNFPMIEQRGDVFTADFTEFAGFDFLIGGSPCTYWSIAQTNNRETEASGMGWELFSQYVRALHEAKPRFFVYENNKSMSKAIRESIDKAFGFEAIGINSALVSAQNRQRLYWVGKRNEDGTYSKVPIEQPEDLGILLKDILESGNAFNVNADGKSHTLMKSYLHAGNASFVPNGRFNASSAIEPVCASLIEQPFGRKKGEDGQYDRRYEARTDGRANALVATHQKQFGMVAEPVAMRQVGRRINENGHRDDYNENLEHIQRYEVNENPQKTNCLTTVTKDNMVAEPVNVTADGKAQCLRATYYKDGIRNMVGNTIDRKTCVAEPVPGYATPCEWDENGKPIKAISAADGKIYQVYEVKDGQITIKGKEYPIKLVDGYYIIRKLTVRECMRLQTVPEWYEFPVSDSQAFKMLGNGWSCRVIEHLLRGCMAALDQPTPEKEPKRVVVKRINR